MKNMRLVGFLKILANLKVITGLHIGSGSSGITIGEVDNPVIKINGKPYIPGSSLKGKLRSLLEHSEKLEIDNKEGLHICNNENCDLCAVFGRPAEKKGKEGPTRIIFRDSYLNEEKSEKEARENGFLEIKWENRIHRLTGKVEVSLRDIERVLPGTVFDLEIIYRIYESDLDGKNIEEVKEIDNLPNKLKNRFGLIIKGLKLLEMDYLGGCGTRGYGKVKIENIVVELHTIDAIKKNKPVVLKNGSLSDLYESLQARI